MEQLRVVVYGEVQGVFYRASAQEKARELGVLGTVKNREDGTVEVIAEASPHVLEQFLEYLHDGPTDARVTKVTVSWHPPTNAFYAFSIER